MSCGRMGTTGLQLSTDVSQKMSFAPQFEITNSITAELTRIERARGFLDAAKLSEDWIAGMQSAPLCLRRTIRRISKALNLRLNNRSAFSRAKRSEGLDRMIHKSSSTTRRRLNWFRVTWRAASRSLRY